MKYNTGKDEGENNIFIGQFSGTNTTEDHNIFIGNYSGYSNDTGKENIFMGRSSGYTNDEGSFNTFFGYESGFLNQSGNYNLFIGHQSGYNETGSYMLYISNQNDTDNKPTLYGNLNTSQIAIATTNLGSYSLTVVKTCLWLNCLSSKPVLLPD